MTSPTQGAQASREKDEAAITALYYRLLDCWNRREAGEFAAQYTEDGSQVGFDGSQIEGRAQIEAHLRQIFADHMTAAYVGKVREVRFLSAQSALLRAVAGMIPPGKNDLNPAANAVQSLVAMKSYFDANPQAGKDMQQLQQPLVTMSARCRLPISLPQLMGLMQTAQSVGQPGAALPATPSPESAVTQGTGPLPGPSAGTSR